MSGTSTRTREVEEMAADMLHRNILGSLSVRPLLDSNGKNTGKYEVPRAGVAIALSRFL